MAQKSSYAELEEKIKTLEKDLAVYRKAHEIMRDNDENWRALVGNTDAIIQVLDLDGNILYMNRPYPSQKLDNVIGKPAFEFLAPDTHAEVRKTLEKMRSGAGPQTIEMNVALTNSETALFETKWVPMAEKGKFDTIIALSRDITGRKQAEAALHSSLFNLEKMVTKRTRLLVERVKELKCLLSISKLFDRPDIPLEVTLRAVVDLIASSCQNPNITCVRIILEESEVQTINFIETRWKQTCDIKLYEKRIGSLEVCYLESKPEIDAGPFSKKEIGLLESIAESLSNIIARKRMEDELKSKARSLEELNSALNTILDQRNQDRVEYENKLVANTKLLILPFLDRLADMTRDRRQLALIESIQENLEEVASSFSHSLNSRYFDLSPAEIRVAKFVKMGKSSRKIADILKISIKTVKNHRHKIREKLGIKNRDMNLRTFLLYLE